MKKNTLIIVLLIVAVGAVLELKKHNPAVAHETVPAPVAMPRLLELGSAQCIPCKMMTPILDEMAKTFAGQLAVDFIDVHQQESGGKQYGLRVIPTQIFFDARGNELFRHEGFFPREEILAKWQELGYALEEN